MYLLSIGPCSLERNVSYTTGKLFEIPLFFEIVTEAQYTALSR